MDLHFTDANGNHFVVPDAPEGYTREDATLIEPPPSAEHRWIDGAWAVPAPQPAGPNLSPLVPWQFWAMLRITGKEQAVRDFVAALPEPAKTVADAQLEFSLEFRRDHPLVENVRAVLGMTETELDALWDQGHQLSL